MRYEVDMRYLGQAHEVPVEIPNEMVRRMDGETLARLIDLFHDKHLHLFGHASRDSEIEFMTLTVAAIGPMTRGSMLEIEAGTADASAAFKGTRKVFFEEAGDYIDCNTYERSRLKANNLISGPAIIEQMDTTTVLPPGETAEVDKYGTLIVELATQAGDQRCARGGVKWLEILQAKTYSPSGSSAA